MELQEKSIRYVPVAKAWLKHARGREFQAVLVFRGFIDESHDPNPIPKVFDLSCLVAYDNLWPWFEMAWVKVLEDKNEELTKQGRSTISRYHAADCSSLRGEFKGWSVEEQIEFSLKLFDVFRRHPVHIHSFDMPLQLLVQEIPEVAPNPVGFAYVILLIMLMGQIGDGTLGLYPEENITLHHDHCDYDGALADGFGLAVDERIFDVKNWDRFISITPEYWQHSVLLQAADMIAYENFKEGMRHHYPEGRGRRKSLTAIIDLEAVSGKASGFTLEAIGELKSLISGMSPQTKKRFFDAARIIL